MQIQNSEKVVLLVDDEADIREVLDITMTDMGYRVLMAENGEEALTVFKKHKPPMVLTDIKMPTMDGIELLKHIKRINPECEVIMITGHGDMGLAIKSLKHKATDFITKPINIDALEISLKRASEKIITRDKLKAYTENLEALIREKSELQDNLSSLGLMIGSISHGIKSLLTGLDAGIYLVDSGIAKKSLVQVEEGWQVVKTMIQRIRKLTQDILFQAKERELDKEPVDLLAFVEDIEKIILSETKKHDISLTSRFEKKPGTCTMDAKYVSTALINILENAIDACLKSSSDRKKEIIFGMKTDHDTVVFFIRDNGVGMDMKTRDKVFSLFYSSKGNKGTGLGLYISNKIIGQHGGTINIDSVPGQGSQFTVKIPRNSN